MARHSHGELVQMEQAGKNAERCVCCGDIIPEGRQVCPICEELSKSKMRKATESTTITMGGDGKSHRIPDELWWMIDALVRGYDEAIEMEYMNPAIAALQEVWAETIRMDRRKDND